MDRLKYPAMRSNKTIDISDGVLSIIGETWFKDWGDRSARKVCWDCPFKTKIAGDSFLYLLFKSSTSVQHYIKDNSSPLSN